MSSFLTWVSKIIGDAILGVTGGNIFLMVLFGILAFALALFRFNVSMPFALLASFFALAVLSQNLDNPLDVVLGTGSTGITFTLFLIVAALSGVLLWHLLVKKSQAGVG